MCTGPEIFMLAGTGMNMLGSLSGGQAQAAQHIEAARQSGAQAGRVTAAAELEAQQIRRNTGRAVSSARAAIGASGGAVDEFTLNITQDITQRGEQDAQMSILSGLRESRALMEGAAQHGKAAKNAQTASLIEATGHGLSGWQGMKGSSTNSGGSKGFDPINSFYLGGNRSVGD